MANSHENVQYMLFVIKLSCLSALSTVSVRELQIDCSMEYFYFGLVVSIYVFVLRLANDALFLVDQEKITNLAKLGKVSKAPKTLNDLFVCIYIYIYVVKYNF